MYIPLHTAKLEALRRHGPTDGHTHWFLNQPPVIPILLKFANSIRRHGTSLIERRSDSAAHTNLIIGLVVGFTLAAFLAGVCVFLCCYGDSIRFSKKKQRHRRRSMSSKGSRHSKTSREVERAEGAPESERGG
ncbi:hypothetical protein V8C35DRAFT_263373 [Trichoderma chlorosporum]